MKTREDAARLLLENGWTLEEIIALLGNKLQAQPVWVWDPFTGYQPAMATPSCLPFITDTDVSGKHIDAQRVTWTSGESSAL